ncbi:MAG: hypothetical protein ACTJLM_02080 [Ehrlichia sp.]
MLKRITQCVVIFCLCIIPCTSLSRYSSLSQCSDASEFNTLDTLSSHPYPFCDIMLKEVKALDFRIVPFYMQSFFSPKLSLVLPSSKGLSSSSLTISSDNISRDFESMMSDMRSEASIYVRLRSRLKKYGVTYYGTHRRNIKGFDDVCIYYGYVGQCIKQCFPIPALKRPKVKEEVGKIGEKGKIVVEVSTKKLSEDTDSDTRFSSVDEKKLMSIVELQKLVSKDIALATPMLKWESHELMCLSGSECTISDTEGISGGHGVQCVKGLNYSGLGYYVKKYDKTIGGHRYFWVRLNKRKLVRQRYDDGEYRQCDDSMSYDLDNIPMKSFLASIMYHDGHYVIPRSGYRIAKYKTNREESLCRNSELYFDSTTVLRRIKDYKECIFGKVQYSSDEKEQTKSCLYNYSSIDFETFGKNRNRNELRNVDFFLVNGDSLNGLTQVDPYLEGMCVDKFPKYEYRVKRHMNGSSRHRYVYYVGKHQPNHYHKCDFIKIEAWGGGQAGYIENGKAYSGAPGNYTFGILKVDDKQGKKIVIHVGEGGKVSWSIWRRYSSSAV